LGTSGEWIKDKWREAIDKEHKKMEIHKEFKLIERKTMPKDKRCVKFKWVFDAKRNGTFRARLVAFGYSQVPGIDFKETYSPVANDVAFRIVRIVYQILHKLSLIVMDVETAFLNLHGMSRWLETLRRTDCSIGKGIIWFSAKHKTILQEASQGVRKDWLYAKHCRTVFALQEGKSRKCSTHSTS
jgi:Reverse transcriptase (RNA-dependent DNA polymerase)